MKIPTEKIKEVEKEIEEMEKLAEEFADNRFVKLGKRKALGIDAVTDCSNFLLEYDRREAKLSVYKEWEAREKEIEEKLKIRLEFIDDLKDRKFMEIEIDKIFQKEKK